MPRGSVHKRSSVKAGKSASSGLLLGYARVSKDDEQTNTLQARLRAAGCRRILEEVGDHPPSDAAAQLAERRARELRPGYYRYQAAEMIPLVGAVLGIADQMGDASHSRELDHLNEDARDAQHRRDYLKGIQPVHCDQGPQTVPPPLQSATR